MEESALFFMQPRVGRRFARDMMTAAEQKRAAREFAAEWSGRGYEKGECQKFWRALLHGVFGVEDPDDWLQYEVPVATGFVDAYISRTKVLIEQKGFEHGLADKAAMKQAMMYVGAMPDTMPVRYIVLSNFQEFWIYDKHAPEMKPVKVALKDLSKKLRVLGFSRRRTRRSASLPCATSRRSTSGRANSWGASTGPS